MKDFNETILYMHIYFYGLYSRKIRNRYGLWNEQKPSLTKISPNSHCKNVGSGIESMIEEVNKNIKTMSNGIVNKETKIIGKC